MPFSHHSHSGQFCAHAVNTLEEVVQAAVAKGMSTLALTEHIYRKKEDFYPEEEKEYTEEKLKQKFGEYMTEAVRLRDVYSSKINIMVGFESEWIRPSSEDDIQEVLSTYSGSLDFFVGSIHHVFTFPIDFDKGRYQKAWQKAGGSNEKLFVAYFKEMDRMLRTLKPPVVGHFDVIRLMCDDPNTQFEAMEEAWGWIHHNLDYINSYGGILELNSAALRKGLAEPYPGLSICRYFLSIGGRFTISDDSHGISQVGTFYPQLLAFIKKAGIEEIWYADREATAPEGGRCRVGFSKISVESLGQHPFWTTN